MIIVKKIWINSKRKDQHNRNLVQMYGLYLFGFIPIFICEKTTVDGVTRKEQIEAQAQQLIAQKQQQAQQAAIEAERIKQKDIRNNEIAQAKADKIAARKKKKADQVAANK